MERSDIGNVVITLKPGQFIAVGPDIRVGVTQVRGRHIRVLIQAPKSVKVDRKAESFGAKKDEKPTA